MWHVWPKTIHLVATCIFPENDLLKIKLVVNLQKYWINIKFSTNLLNSFFFLGCISHIPLLIHVMEINLVEAHLHKCINCLSMWLMIKMELLVKFCSENHFLKMTIIHRNHNNPFLRSIKLGWVDRYLILLSCVTLSIYIQGTFWDTNL